MSETIEEGKETNSTTTETAFFTLLRKGFRKDSRCENICRSVSPDFKSNSTGNSRKVSLATFDHTRFFGRRRISLPERANRGFVYRKDDDSKRANKGRTNSLPDAGDIESFQKMMLDKRKTFGKSQSEITSHTDNVNQKANLAQLSEEKGSIKGLTEKGKLDSDKQSSYSSSISSIDREEGQNMCTIQVIAAKDLTSDGRRRTEDEEDDVSLSDDVFQDVIISNNEKCNGVIDVCESQEIKRIAAPNQPSEDSNNDNGKNNNNSICISQSDDVNDNKSSNISSNNNNNDENKNNNNNNNDNNNDSNKIKNNKNSKNKGSSNNNNNNNNSHSNSNSSSNDSNNNINNNHHQKRTKKKLIPSPLPKRNYNIEEAQTESEDKKRNLLESNINLLDIPVEEKKKVKSPSLSRRFTRKFIFPSQNTESALKSAISNQDFDLLQKLLASNSASFDINFLHPPGVSILHQACILGNFQTVKLLVEKGADVRLRTWSNLSPLMLATICGHFDVAQLLLLAGANVEDVKNGHQEFY